MDNARLQAVKLLGKTFSKGGIQIFSLIKLCLKLQWVKRIKTFVLLYTMEF